MIYTIMLNEDLNNEADNMCCFIYETEWNNIYNTHVGAKQIFAKIDFDCITIRCVLGQPLSDLLIQDTSSSCIFLPAWAFTTLKSVGVGDSVNVEWYSEESSYGDQ